MNNLCACVERRPSVTLNPLATFFSLNSSGFFLLPPLPFFQPCRVSLLLWSSFFRSRCQAQPRQRWLGFSTVNLSRGWQEPNARRTLPSRGRRDFSGAAAEVNPKDLRVFMPDDGPTHLSRPLSRKMGTCIQRTSFVPVTLAPPISHQVSLR